MRTNKLIVAQVDVLTMACTHGNLMEGCRNGSGYGGRLCTLASLRMLGLLDAMYAPTGKGQVAFTTGRVSLPPNVALTRRL